MKNNQKHILWVIAITTMITLNGSFATFQQIDIGDFEFHVKAGDVAVKKAVSGRGQAQKKIESKNSQ
jgi:uncharacterized protein YxeA